MFIVRPMGYVNVGSYTVPGYYTLIVFSAPWCAPCRKLQSEALVWLEKYPNLVFVDLDVGTASSLNQKSSAVLADLDREVLLPAALLMNPFGVYINGGKTLGVAPPFSGADAIRSVMVGFAKRKHKDVVPFDGETEKRLRELKRLRAKKADVARQN
jgi:thiol-disulfide isomerase/thioredoxin